MKQHVILIQDITYHNDMRNNIPMKLYSYNANHYTKQQAIDTAKKTYETLNKNYKYEATYFETNVPF